MARTKKAKKERVHTKTEEKAKNIQLVINAYQDSNSNLSMSAAAKIFNYSKDFISNHTNPYGEYGFLPDHYVESQKLSPSEELALIVHISDCYNAGLPCHGTKQRPQEEHNGIRTKTRKLN
jgi:hypothetical protein